MINLSIHKKKALVYIIFTCLLISSSIKAEEIVIIAHKDFPTDSISNEDIEKLYLGKTKTVAGHKAVPITLKDGPVHDTFLDLYIKKNSNQFSSHWKKILFTGKGKPPKSAKSDEEMIKLISENEGSIGYIAASSVKEGIKILKIK